MPLCLDRLLHRLLRLRHGFRLLVVAGMLVSAGAAGAASRQDETSRPNAADRAHLTAAYGKLPLSSEPNRGLVSAIEGFDDGLLHRSIFFVDAQGKATSAVSDASTATKDVSTVRPAFTTDAAYVSSRISRT